MLIVDACKKMVLWKHTIKGKLVIFFLPLCFLSDLCEGDRGAFLQEQLESLFQLFFYLLLCGNLSEALIISAIGEGGTKEKEEGGD